MKTIRTQLFEGLQWTTIDVPEFASEEEEATWWDTHKKEADDLIERAQKARALRVGTLAGQVKTKQTTLRLRSDDLRRAKELAHRKGIGYQTYLKMLIHEGLERADKAS